MTSNQHDNDGRLREIIQEIKRPDTNVDSLIAEALALCDESRFRPAERALLQHDQHGFSNQVGIDYYLKPPLSKEESGYKPFRGMSEREYPGKLVVLKQNGEQGDVSHDIAQRNEYLIGAPISRIQELAQLPGDTAIIELPDLTEYIGEPEGGVIALVMQKRHLEQIVRNTRYGVASLLDLVVTPGRREALEEALKKPRGL